MQSDLSKGGVVATILRFALPLAVGMGSHAAFNLIDLYIVGALGEDAVAAVHVAGVINFFPMILGNGISVGTVALLAPLLAQSRTGAARGLADLSALLMTGLSILLGLACYFAAEELVVLQAATGDGMRLGTDYLEIASLGTISMYLLMHVTGILRAMGNAFWPVVLLIGSNLLNIGLDIVLVFGFEPLGIPAIGVAGAAWASVLARVVGCIVGFVVLARPGSPLPPGMRMPSSVAETLRRIAWLGVPQSIQMFVRASLILTMTRLAGRLAGNSAQAALGVATRLDTFILFSAVGWASGATAIVGQCSGKGLLGRCQRFAWGTAGFAGAMALVTALVFALCARQLLLLFVPDAGDVLLREGTLYLTILAFAHPAASASLVLAGAWNGAGNSIKPMLLDLFAVGLILQPALWSWEWAGAPGGLATCWSIVLAGNWLLLGVYFLYMRDASWARDGATSGDAPAKVSGGEGAS